MVEGYRRHGKRRVRQMRLAHIPYLAERDTARVRRADEIGERFEECGQRRHELVLEQVMHGRECGLVKGSSPFPIGSRRAPHGLLQ